MAFATSLASTQVKDGVLRVGVQDAASGWYWQPVGNRVVATADSAANKARILAAVAEYDLIEIDTSENDLVLADQGDIRIDGGTSVRGYRGNPWYYNLSGDSRILVGHDRSMTTLNTNATACTVASNGLSITTAMAASVGDWVIIWSDDALPGATHFNPGTQSPMEMAIVERVDGTTLYLDRELVDKNFYTSSPRCVNVTADAAFVESRDIVFDVAISRGSNKTGGTGTNGFEFHYCRGLRLNTIDNTNAGAINLINCIGTVVDDWRNDGQTGDNAIYGLVVNSCDDTLVTNFVGSEGSRHLATTGGRSIGTQRWATNSRTIFRTGLVNWSSLQSTTNQSILDTHADGNGVLFDDIEVRLSGSGNKGGGVGPIMFAFQSRSRNTHIRRCRMIGEFDAYHFGVRALNSEGSTLVEDCLIDGGYVGVSTIPAGAGEPSVSIEVRDSHIRNLTGEALLADGGNIRSINNDIENCGDSTSGITGGANACITCHTTSGNAVGTVHVERTRITKGTANNTHSIRLGDATADNVTLIDNEINGFDECFLGLDLANDAAALPVLIRDFRRNNDRQDALFRAVGSHSLDIDDNRYNPILRNGDVYDDTLGITTTDDILGLLLGISGDVLCLAEFGHRLRLENEYLPITYDIGSDPLRAYWDADLITSHSPSKTGAFVVSKPGDSDESAPAIFKIAAHDGSTTTATMILGTFGTVAPSTPAITLTSSGLQQVLFDATQPAGSTVFDEKSTIGDRRPVQPGRCYNFDGIDDHVSCGTSLFTSATAITFSCWFNPDSLSASQNTLISINYTFPSSGVLIRTQGAKLNVFTDDGTERTSASTADLVIGEWSHIAVTISLGGEVRIYINGALDSTHTGKTFNFNTGIGTFIGQRGAPSGAYVDGKVFDARVYGDVLSPDEINYVQTLGRIGTDPTAANLLGHWKLDEGASTTAYDSSGSGNDGTIANALESSFHYTGSDVPHSWHNDVGYSDGVGGVLIPRDESDSINDVLGAALGYSGIAPIDATLTQSNCSTFDGVDDQILIGNDIWNSQSQGTITAWIKSEASGEQAIFSAASASSSTALWYLRLDGGKLGLIFDSNGKSVEGDTVMATSTWYHVAVVSDGVSHKLYVDGVEQSLTLVGANNGNWWDDTVSGVMQYSLGIVKRSTGDIAPLDGSMADVRLYGAPLTSGQLTYVMTGGNTGTVPPAAIGHWPLAEGAGRRVYDVTTGGNHGTITNATLSTFWDKQDVYHFNVLNGFDQVAYFDGGGSKVDVPYGFLHGATRFTLSCWVYYDSASANRSGPFGADLASFSGVCIRSDTGGTQWNVLAAQSGSFFIDANTATSISKDTWQHIAVVYDGSDCLFYVNGVLTDTLAAGDSAVVNDVSSSNYAIGGAGSGSFLNMTGAVSDLRVYDASLSASEISYLYSSGQSGADPSDTDLVGHWPLDEGFGTTTVDLSTGGNDGTISGATAAEFWALKVPKANQTGAVNHPAGVYHNGAETLIDCTGGVSFPGASARTTDWAFHDALANPEFSRELSSGDVVVRVDRFVAYEDIVSDATLVNVLQFTLNDGA